MRIFIDLDSDGWPTWLHSEAESHLNANEQWAWDRLHEAYASVQHAIKQEQWAREAAHAQRMLHDTEIREGA
jgi:hypothetical protein